jgi:hypothetical protein
MPVNLICRFAFLRELRFTAQQAGAWGTAQHKKLLTQDAK